MSLLKLISRYMERNQAVSRVMIKQFDQDSITEMDKMSDALWLTIKESKTLTHNLIIVNDQVVPYEFVVKLLIKIGFECEQSVRLLMAFHSVGCVGLAVAEYELLLNLQEYIDEQAKNHGVTLLTEVVEV